MVVTSAMMTFINYNNPKLMSRKGLEMHDWGSASHHSRFEDWRIVIVFMLTWMILRTINLSKMATTNKSPIGELWWCSSWVLQFPTTMPPISNDHSMGNYNCHNHSNFSNTSTMTFLLVISLSSNEQSHHNKILT